MASAPPSEIVEFGPFHTIGISLIGNEPTKCKFVWEQGIFPRTSEILKPTRPLAFGFCRCVPGATADTFEYVAAFEALPDAPVPPGMIAVDIPRTQYIAIPVASLAVIGEAWHSIPSAVAAHPGYTAHCGPTGCDCAHFPTFEYYPHTFPKDGRLFVYVPVSKTP
jgi:predicted transcriptional regulator YdeE